MGVWGLGFRVAEHIRNCVSVVISTLVMLYSELIKVPKTLSLSYLVLYGKLLFRSPKQDFRCYLKPRNRIIAHKGNTTP